MPLTIEVANSRKQKEQFLKLPFRLYASVPQWTPPILREERRVLGFESHPFYTNAGIKHFICYDNGKPIARAAGIINSQHNHTHGARDGFFGFFDSEHDQEAVNLLFRSLNEWFQSLGVRDVYGPVNPSLNYTCGTLLDGFNVPTAIMMPYNHYYYDELLQGAGFSKAQDLMTYYASYAPNGKVPSVEELLDDKIIHTAQIGKRMLDVTTRQVTKASLQHDVAEFLRLYNESMQQTWMFTPLTRYEIRDIADQLKWLIIPELATVAEKEGKIIGALLNLPDINDTIRDIGGKLAPFGWIQMLKAPQRAKHVRCICANVSPEYQMQGVAAILVADSIIPAIKLGITSVEFSWILETNDMAIKSLKKHGAKHTRTHRIYHTKLDRLVLDPLLPVGAPAPLSL